MLLLIVPLLTLLTLLRQLLVVAVLVVLLLVLLLHTVVLPTLTYGCGALGLLKSELARCRAKTAVGGGRATREDHAFAYQRS